MQLISHLFHYYYYMNLLLRSFIKAVALVFFIVNGIFAQSSYLEDFSTNTLPNNFSGGTFYKTTVQNNEMKVVVAKGDPWPGLYISMPSPLNLSQLKDRHFSFDIKTDTNTRNISFPVMVQIFSASNIFGTAFERTIHATKNYRTVSFSFTDAATQGSVDFSNIIAIQIVVHPRNKFNGTIYLDNIKLGSNVTPTPYFQGIATQNTYINSGTKTIKILQPTDATDQRNNVSFTAVSSNPTLIPNPTFVESTVASNATVNYFGGDGGGKSYIGGKTVLMNYTPQANQYGVAVITVTATTSSTIPGLTLSESHSIFSVVVHRNNAPTISSIPLVQIGSGELSKIPLSGILNGNPETGQRVTITGVSSDQTIIDNSKISIIHDHISPLGTLQLEPSLFPSLPDKDVNITLTLKDNGGTVGGGIDESTLIIPVKVFPVFYKMPTIDAIRNYTDNIITSGAKTITITGISDGNGGANIASITAKSSNTLILADPIINYSAGNRFATLTYNAQVVGEVTVSVTATNLGAPANSNGNSSFTRTFRVAGLNPPIAGIVEDFSATSVLGFLTNDAGFSQWLQGGYPNVKWNCEHQGSLQNMSIDGVSGIVTNRINKPGSVPQYFAGVWYQPSPGELLDFASSPYLSVRLNSNPPAPVAIDLWDVNGVRYGLTSTQSVDNTNKVYTFCYSGVPQNARFDFSKIQRVLFNFGANGIGNSYNGTISLSELKIGNVADGIGSCTVAPPLAEIDSIGNRYYLTSNSGVKTITITGINGGTSPITGFNPNPVSLSLSSSGPISGISVSTVSGGLAIITFTTPATTGVTNVTVFGSAVNSRTTNRRFSINVINTPGSTLNAVVTNNLSANMPDGKKGQSIDGFGATLNGNVGGDFTPFPYQEVNPMIVWGIQDMEMSMARMSIPPAFEPVNDNDDPNAINKSAFDYNALMIDQYKAYREAGVEKFIGTMWSVPAWCKLNKSYVAFTNQGFWPDNTIDTNYVDEVAEFALAYVTALKEQTGIELYAFDFVNEPQFNQPYTSAMINKQQYVYILKAIGKKFAEHNINTLLFGAETLPAQDGSHQYLTEIQNDPVGRDYLNAYAVHNYDPSGAAPSNPTWSTILARVRDARSNTAALKYYAHPLTPANSVGNGDIGIPAWQTETSGYNNNWGGALSYGIAIHNGLFFGNVGAWTFWTFDDGDPNGSYGLVGKTRIKPIYHVKKHFSKFIKSGARRIPGAVSSTSGVLLTAYSNPDESVVMVVINNNTSAISLSVSGQNMPNKFTLYQSVENFYWNDLGTVSGIVVLPPKSISTFRGLPETFVLATGVTINGNNLAISLTGGSLQLTAEVGPVEVVDKTVSWSIESGGANASISNAGLLQAIKNGIVTIKAASNNNPTVFDIKTVTISGQFVSVTGVSISGLNGGNTITTAGGSLQMQATIAPDDATNKNVLWSVAPALATISGSGLLVAQVNGVVTVTATSQSNPTIKGNYLVTLSNQAGTVVSVTSISVTGVGGNAITVNNAPKQMNAVVMPANATNPSIRWKIEPLHLATINGTGLITPLANGLVTVTATSVEYPQITGTQLITISGQVVPVTGIIVSIDGIAGNMATISSDNGTLKLFASVLPLNATNRNYSFANSNPKIAFVDPSTGDVKAIRNGQITVTGVANDNTSINNTLVINIENQILENNLSIAGTSLINQFRDTTSYTFISFRSYTVLGMVETTTGVFDIDIQPKEIAKLIVIPNEFLLKTFKIVPLLNGVVTVTGRLPEDTLYYFTKVITITGQGIESLSIDVFTEEFEPTNDTIKGIGKTLLLSANYAPFEVLKTDFVWNQLSGTDIVSTELTTVLGTAVNKVMSLALGEAEISLSGYDGIKATKKIYVVKEDSVIKSTIGTLADAVNVYPNPAQGTVTVYLSEGYNNSNLMIKNILGENVFSTPIFEKNTLINVASLPRGIYHVVITNDNKNIVKKLVLK